MRLYWGPEAVGAPPASAATRASASARSREGAERSAGTASDRGWCGEEFVGSAEEVMESLSRR
ncbi:hypothetical protein HMPREF3159_04230 [Brachybacterium sp. HMSC06H03]|nr:hypothetical protein HMPREF3159_04230 [Brachybacterium sp. HMSC06H03]